MGEPGDASVPFVSIVMPCLDEARHIEGCLGAALAQDYPSDHLQVVVADGGSADGTRDIIGRIAGAEPRIALVDNPDRIQAAGLNAAIRRARGDVIVRMDVHADYAPDYVRRCVEVLARSGADNVGGAPRPRGTTTFQRALCAALASPLGVGNAPHWSGSREGPVDTVFNGAFRRDVFERVGLYDTGAITNEDAELNQRIRQAGGCVYLSPAIVAHYYPRTSLAALARQYYRYGRGRARTLLKHGGLLTRRPLLPASLVVAAALLILTSGLQPFTPYLAAAFALLTGAEAVRTCCVAGIPRSIPTVWAIFPVMYAAHGTGMLAGLVRYGMRRDWGEPERLQARASSRPPSAS